jgi:hypothetical protein
LHSAHDFTGRCFAVREVYQPGRVLLRITTSTRRCRGMVDSNSALGKGRGLGQEQCAFDCGTQEEVRWLGGILMSLESAALGQVIERTHSRENGPGAFSTAQTDCGTLVGIWRAERTFMQHCDFTKYTSGMI